MNEVEGYRSLYPPSVVDASTHRILQPVYEGLIRFSAEDMGIEPCLAENWTWDPRSLTYTFYIRRNVFFHADSCFGGIRLRTLTAQDVKFCFDQLCMPGLSNHNSSHFIERIAGAADYYKAALRGKKMQGGVSGIRVISKYIIQIKLTHPYGSFLKLLGTAYTRIYPPEALTFYGARMNKHCVGTGPFVLTGVTKDRLLMERNTHYWQKDSFGNRLPYLDGIEITLNQNRKAELLEFNKNNLDMVYGLPTEFRNHIIDSTGHLQPDFNNCKLYTSAVMTGQYYCFLQTDSIFSNSLVRQAFNLAIDRERIVKSILKDGAVAGNYGIVPPVFEGYGTEQIRGYQFDPARARQLLQNSGFKSGQDFPAVTLHISSNGAEHEQVAREVQSMLSENLDIRIRIESLPWNQHLENIEKGMFGFFRFGWQADYPDPESFLNNFYSFNLPSDGQTPANTDFPRYRSKRFDSLFSISEFTIDAMQRYRLLQDAEQQLMDDAVLMVLYYPKDYVLLKPYVMKFRMNAMQIRDYSQVYFDQNKLNLPSGSVN
jgi:peptide/nickel transport system substrate-binding protein